MKDIVFVQFMLFAFIPLSDSNTAEDECANSFFIVFHSDSLVGQYSNQNWTISFSAHLSRDSISSNITFQSEDYLFDTCLSYQNIIAGRRIPNIKQYIVTAGIKLAMETSCDIPFELSTIYQRFADNLYRCTQSLGVSPLRFSVMYHVSIIGTAERVCKVEHTPLCTPSPEYVYSNEQLFICREDIEYIIFGRQAFQTSENKQCNNKLGWNLEGKDTCCCGDYPGCCLFAHKFCCWHDFVCSCCQHWYCGGFCKPLPSCLKQH